MTKTRTPSLVSTLALFMSAASTSVRADSFTPVGIGSLPNGDIIETYQFSSDPGVCFPWHHHPGTMLVTILSGAASEDKGCNTPIRHYSAGEAFAEKPGEYHHICVTSAVPLVATVTGVLPACFGDFNDEIDTVEGPSCQCGGHVPVFAPGPFLCTDGSGKYSPAAVLPAAHCGDSGDLECEQGHQSRNR
jgi:quercetin dioxygenase-like cupin family protein